MDTCTRCKKEFEEKAHLDKQGRPFCDVCYQELRSRGREGQVQKMPEKSSAKADHFAHSSFSKKSALGIVVLVVLLTLAGGFLLLFRHDASAPIDKAEENQKSSHEDDVPVRPGSNQLAGPISAALSAKPQLVVYGLRSDDSSVESKISEHLAFESGGLRRNVVSEEDVTEEDLSGNNLILFLHPESSLFQRIQGQLPIRATIETIVIGDRIIHWKSENESISFVVFCCPNPFNPEYYATIYSALQPETFFWVEKVNQKATDWLVYGKLFSRGYFSKRDPVHWTASSEKEMVGSASGLRRANRFEQNDDVIVDFESRLIWQLKDSGRDFFDFEEARSYCEQLQLDGKTEWRLPTKGELQDLFDSVSTFSGDWRAKPFEWTGRIYWSTYKEGESRYQALLDFRSGGWYFEGMTGVVRAVHDPVSEL